MKKIIKLILFVIVFLCIYNVVFKVLWTMPNSITSFYEEPKDSLEVIYVGSSNAYAHYNTVLAYKEYGFTTGMLSSDAQPPSGIVYLIKEGEKYQNPEVYVIDMAGFIQDVKLYSEGDVRKVTDTMKFSMNRFDAINNMLDYTDIDKSSYIEYYFSFLTYHSSWKVINKSRYYNEDLYKGFLMKADTIIANPSEKQKWDYTYKDASEENTKIFKDLISFIKDNKLNVVFVISPRAFSNEQMEELNTFTKIADEEGVKLINYNFDDDLSIDFGTDYYNPFHLNTCGSAKMTRHLSDYLVNNYELKDYRNEEEFKSWDDEFDRLSQNYYNITGNSFDDLLERCK